MKCIGVLTSGGDNPGLNPCIRAVVRTGVYLGVKVMGIRRGYAGLIDGEIDEMDARSVGGIIGHGGTILGTARCPEFYEPKGRREALRSLPFGRPEVVAELERRLGINPAAEWASGEMADCQYFQPCVVPIRFRETRPQRG